ncbi:TonB-dependent receptor [soil metagenome]
MIMVPRKVLVSTLLFALASSISIDARAQTQGENTAAPSTLEPPKLVTFVEAEYPPEEKAAGKAAVVVLQIGIAADGSVAAAQIVESAGKAFDDSAIAAVKKFFFTPAKRDGKAIPVRIVYRYTFEIKETQVKRTTADFTGTVRDRKTKKPVAGVTVALDTAQNAVTADDGKFSISEVAPGAHTVTLSAPALTPVSTQETFEASKQLDATYDVELKAGKPSDDDDDFEVVVTAPKIVRQAVSTEIQATQAAKIPGTSGDVLRVVESMPGVARATVGTGAIVVWGAAPEDTGVYVDGVRVPRLYHDGGYRSIIHSDMVRSVELIPAAYGANWGRGIGGIINVGLKTLDDTRFKGTVQVDILDSSLALRAPLGPNVHFSIAGRGSYVREVVRSVAPVGTEDIVPLPRYGDGQARLVFDLSKHDHLELGGLFSTDAIDRTLLDADPTRTKRESRGTTFGRAWVRYTKTTKDGGAIQILPYYGRTMTTREDKFGATPAQLDSTANVFALRASWRQQVFPWLALSLGLDAEMTTSQIGRNGSLTTPAREGDVRVFGQPPSDQVNADRGNTAIGSLGTYAEADLGLFGGKLHIVPGFRVEPYIVSVSKALPVQGDKPELGLFTQDTALEPRISIRWDATSRVTAKAAFGIFHQAPLAEDLSAVFGNPSLGLASAKHSLVGGSFKLTKSTTMEVTGFYNVMDDLVTRSTSNAPAIARALVQGGSGRAYGVQMMLRQEQIGPFFGWISYGITRSERQDSPEAKYRLFDYDQSHTITAVGSFDLGKGWDVGLRLRFSTGFPRTPVVGAAYNARTDTYEPVFGDKNSTRIPVFFQADLRVAKTFHFAGTELQIYLDVYNFVARNNPEELVYNYDYTQRSMITGIPILPVAGMKWTF